MNLAGQQTNNRLRQQAQSKTIPMKQRSTSIDGFADNFEISEQDNSIQLANRENVLVSVWLNIRKIAAIFRRSN